ncbi:exonuclease SbcCD subunit D [Microbacterium flavum]|uniref:Nuclease SbcCD subunit D n=1 Tax=Microbacterium flavum TaxID=415216 RepID=A0ABS5XPY3_9MICO|nr:exonuclease SbcCD subunit D C-terminal domain-containing protein [Microbacterium flavum]MBT8796592.1 exonuclease SbcCD subunit D C-terminal domain-containing protein [Microbacterium flavum]
MKILHTSDWHIGRTFHGHSTLDALRGVLDVLVAQVREEGVDLVIVAGDVFDSATPAAACYGLLSDTLAALADTGAQVVVTSGNHDSAARLGFQARLLRSGIHVLTDPAAVGTPITLHDAHGPVQVYGIPYLEPALLRHEWPGVRSQAGALAHAMDLVRADAATRRAQDGASRGIAIAHCFAAGVEPTPHLERDIQQGGLDVVPLSTFDGMDYVALGHIHGRQQLSEQVRYAGAPLHYSFGEGAKPRGSWLVDLDAEGFAGAAWLPLPVPRALQSLRGAFDDILHSPDHRGAEDAWVSVEYTDALPEPDALRRLQERFPHCASVVHTPPRSASDDARTYVQRVRAARSDADLVEAFLVHVRAGEGATEPEAELVHAVLEERVRAERDDAARAERPVRVSA